MKEFLNSRVVWYISCYLVFCTIKYFCGFETTVLWIGTYILVDIMFIDKTKRND